MGRGRAHEEAFRRAREQDDLSYLPESELHRVERVSFFRRKRVTGGGEALIRLYGHGPTADQLTASTVQWKGDADALPYLLPAYFDKIVFNLALMPREQQALLERFAGFVNRARADLARTPGTMVDARIELAPIIDEPPSEQPVAVIRVELILIPEQGRAGAATYFTPVEAENETVAELAWWTLWDWSVRPFGDNKALVEFILNALAVQLAHYRRRGVPGLMDLGRAPYAALQTAAAGLDDSAEIAEPERLELEAELFAGDPLNDETDDGASEETKEGGIVGVLNGELSGEAYGQAAMDLVEEAGAGRLPPIPQVAKDRALFLIEVFPDQKILQKYGDSLLEAFGCSYRFATAETWEDLDREQARSLIDDGLARVHQQHLDTGVPDPLDASVPEQRVHFSMIGLSGTHPAFEQVRQYIFTRSAYQRLETLDELHLGIGLAAGGVKGRHTDHFMQAQVSAWQIGRALGILDVLGEIRG